jgi:acetylornithine/succinyldiaminopimelate/putrescine aminotransferase
MGKRLADGLRALMPEKPLIAGVRGMAGMIGLVVREDAPGACARLREAGLLTVPAGGNALRFLLPYTVTADEIDEALRIVRCAL